MAETAVIMAVVAVAAVASAGAAVYSGVQQREAGQAMRAQYEEERNAARLAADQEEAIMRRRLNATLSAQDALRAGRGLDLMSPTGQALRARSIEDAEMDMATLRMTGGRTDRRLQLSGDVAEGRGEAAFYGGLAGAFNSLASGATGGYRIMSGGTSTGGTP